MLTVYIGLSKAQEQFLPTVVTGVGETTAQLCSRSTNISSGGGDEQWFRWKTESLPRFSWELTNLEEREKERNGP